MDEHPLRIPHRRVVLPLLCAAAGTAAGLLSELGSPTPFTWEVPSLGGALGAGVGAAGVVSSRLWLNVLLSPVLSWASVAGWAWFRIWEAGNLLSLRFIASVLWMPKIRMAVLLMSLPAALMHSWRLRRGRRRLRLDVPLAATLGLAVALASSASVGDGWTPRLSEAIFLVAYFVGILFALEAALRIAGRAPSASPR